MGSERERERERERRVVFLIAMNATTGCYGLNVCLILVGSVLNFSYFRFSAMSKAFWSGFFVPIFY